MSDNNFKSIWQSASESGLVSIEQRSFLNDLSSKINTLNRTIEKRNSREKIVAIMLIAIFSLFAFIVPHTLTKIASVLMIPYCLFYMYKINSVRSQQNDDFSKPPKQFLLSQKAYLQKEKTLLDTVFTWAILPMLLILILFYAGFSMDLESYLRYGGFTLAVSLAVYLANKYAVKKTFIPLLEDLDIIIRDFEEEKD